MLLIGYGNQRPISSLLRAIKGFLSSLGFISKPVLSLIRMLSVPISFSTPIESHFYLNAHPEYKTLKNPDKGTISKSDTSFCALFQRISLKGGHPVSFDLLGGHPNIKVR